MTEHIVIHPVTRVEGHARITIHVDDAGEVSSAQFHVAEFRGFEKLCEGRPFYEMPGLMSRICGICPISHILSSSKAGDMLLGVDIPRAAEKQRRIVNYAQILQSHALSFFHLSSPDFFLGMDSAPEKRHLFGVAEKNPILARRGIRLRQFGQRIIELIGGRRIHPAWGTPGGVLTRVGAAQRDEILGWIPEALESMEMAFDQFKPVLDALAPEIEYLGNFPTLFMGTITPEGGLEFYDGLIRIVDAERNIVAEGLDPRRYASYIGEASEEWSYMKFPYYKPLGYPGGAYRVGPLARLNVAQSLGTPLAEREFREFRQRSRGAVCQSFFFHLARLIEMLYAIERIEELANDPDLLGEPVRAKAGQNRHHGIGSCEAPRGVLFHDYEVDDNGLMKHVNLLIATAQNNLAMNQAVEQTARHFVVSRKLQEGMLNRVEAAIRCFDPCLSCSTHAAGQMPLSVELRDSSGQLLDRVQRG